VEEIIERVAILIQELIEAMKNCGSVKFGRGRPSQTRHCRWKASRDRDERFGSFGLSERRRGMLSYNAEARNVQKEEQGCLVECGGEWITVARCADLSCVVQKTIQERPIRTFLYSLGGCIILVKILEPR